MNKIQVYKTSLLVIGLINNFSFCIVLSSAQDLAYYFGMNNLVGLLGFALALPGPFVVVFNSAYLLKISHETRIKFTLAMNVVAIAILSVFSSFEREDRYAFWICIVFCAFCGMAPALGESIMIGFVNEFPPQCISGWSSGCGLAGLVSSGSYVLLKQYKASNFTIYSMLIPMQIIYWILFEWLSKQKDINNLKKQKNITQNLLFSLQSFKNVSVKIMPSLINFGLIYVFQYLIITCFADIVSRQYLLRHPYSNSNIYAILLFFYQLGTFLSRSSLEFIIIKQHFLLTAAQAFGFISWFIFCFSPPNLYVLVVLMIFVGVIGGTAYANIYYSIIQNENNKLNNTEIELAINLLVLMSDIAITLSIGLGIIITNTIFN